MPQTPPGPNTQGTRAVDTRAPHKQVEPQNIKSPPAGRRTTGALPTGKGKDLECVGTGAMTGGYARGGRSGADAYPASGSARPACATATEISGWWGATSSAVSKLKRKAVGGTEEVCAGDMAQAHCAAPTAEPWQCDIIPLSLPCIEHRREARQQLGAPFDTLPTPTGTKAATRATSTIQVHPFLDIVSG